MYDLCTVLTMSVSGCNVRKKVKVRHLMSSFNVALSQTQERFTDTSKNASKLKTTRTCIYGTASLKLSHVELTCFVYI